MSGETPEDDTEDGFEHPDEDEIEVTDADDIPEVNSADDVVDGNQAKKERLIKKAEELKAEAEATETEDDDGTTDLTPVATRDEDEPSNMGEAIEKAHNDPDSDFDAGETADAMEESAQEAADAIEQAGESLFSPDEEEELEEEFGDVFELNEVDDIPDDFDYESQDTSHYGTAEEAVIQHNDTYFQLAPPEGAREDKFWSVMQSQTSMGNMFDALIRYTVERPEDIDERMESENWTTFSKAGLAMQCSSFLGLDQLQDF